VIVRLGTMSLDLERRIIGQITEAHFKLNVPILPGDLRYPPMHDKQTEHEREVAITEAEVALGSNGDADHVESGGEESNEP